VKRGNFLLLGVLLLISCEQPQEHPHPGPDASCSDVFEYESHRCANLMHDPIGCRARADARFQECMVVKHGAAVRVADDAAP
jgi:hypothetical protein